MKKDSFKYYGIFTQLFFFSLKLHESRLKQCAFFVLIEKENQSFTKLSSILIFLCNNQRCKFNVSDNLLTMERHEVNYMLRYSPIFWDNYFLSKITNSPVFTNFAESQLFLLNNTQKIFIIPSYSQGDLPSCLFQHIQHFCLKHRINCLHTDSLM